MRKLFVLFLLLNSLNLLAAEQRLISVIGEAEKSFEPDIVSINISIWGKGDSAKKAQSNNQGEYEVFKKSMEKFKLKKEDVKTTSYNLNPEYVYDQKTNRNNISGYTVTQEFSVKMRKIEEAGPFVDSLTSSSKAMTSGVNVNSLGFDLEKREAEEKAMMTDAVKEAEEQAKVLAKAADVKLKGLFRLAPVTAGQMPVPMYRAEMMSKALGGSADGGATQMMTGQVKVRAQVSADYMIE